jgi:negative regulator of flagellin synthesis FlgM
MKITGSNPMNPAAGASAPAAIEAAEPAESADRAPASAAGSPAMRAAELESAVLKPAQAALAEMPDVDPVKVAALRDALAKGEIKFDATRLSQLIQRYHGGRS